jgi:flagellar hook assembly protein FlgD
MNHKATTSISFTLSEAATVTIVITDKSGRVWITLGPISGVAGANQITWDGASQNGQMPPPGQSTYTVTITAMVGGQNANTGFTLIVKG